LETIKKATSALAPSDATGFELDERKRLRPTFEAGKRSVFLEARVAARDWSFGPYGGPHGMCKLQAGAIRTYIQVARSGDNMAGTMKHIQVIDGALNCTYDIFASSEGDFDEIFPDGQDIEFIEDFIKRVGKKKAGEITQRLFFHRVDKKTVQGIQGTLFYELGFKKQFYPTKKEAEMVTGV
jgi:hypothetical protein